MSLLSLKLHTITVSYPDVILNPVIWVAKIGKCRYKRQDLLSDKKLYFPTNTIANCLSVVCNILSERIVAAWQVFRRNEFDKLRENGRRT